MRMGVTALHVRGDLRLGEDLAVDGWCWCPARPRARLVPELLVNGRVVGRLRADAFRRDLLAAGIGDGRHGFATSLSGADFDAAVPAIVSARAGAGGITFGQVRRDPPVPSPASWMNVETAVATLSAAFARAVRRAEPEGWRVARLSHASAELAHVLRARGAGHNPLAAARAVLAAAASGLALNHAVANRLAIVVPPVGSAEAALMALRAVAGAAASLCAPVLLLDAGADARVLLLASVVPGLGLRRGPASGTAAEVIAAALPHVGADWLALARPGATMSGAALGRLLAALEARGAASATVDTRLGPGAAGDDVFATEAPVGVVAVLQHAALEGREPAEVLARPDGLFAQPWAPRV